MATQKRTTTRTAATNAPAYAEEWQARLAADPVWMAAYQALKQNSPLPGTGYSKQGYSQTNKTAYEAALAQMQQRESQLGFERPHDFKLNLSRDTPTFERSNFAERNKDWIVPAVTLAAGVGPFAAQALGTAAATGGLTGGAAAPAGTTAGATGATVPIAAGGSAWGKALTELIPLGLQVGGNLINRSLQNKGIDAAQAAQQAGTDAAQARIDAAQRTQGDVYNQQRKDYQTVANVPMQALGNALGIPIGDIGPVSFVGGNGGATLADIGRPPDGPPPTLSGASREGVPNTAPWREGIGPAQPQTLGSMGTADTMPAVSPQQQAQQRSMSSYVPMRSPDGELGQVPAHRVQEALSAGATLVGA